MVSIRDAAATIWQWRRVRCSTGLRKRMTRFFGGDQDASDRLVFGYNVTDALNLIIPGLVSPGGHIITTNLEHNSVIRPVNHMVRDHGAEATFVPFDSRWIRRSWTISPRR